MKQIWSSEKNDPKRKETLLGEEIVPSGNATDF